MLLAFLLGRGPVGGRLPSNLGVSGQALQIPVFLRRAARSLSVLGGVIGPRCPAY